jgi:hypothetical protein
MRISTLFFLLVLPLVFATPRQGDLAQQPATFHVVPLKKFSPEHRFETVSGDASAPGAPFVIRIHAEAGYIIMHHRHSIDENIVVLKGSWALGMGERYNAQPLEPMEAGTFGLAPKNMAHFALSKTYTLLQVHGIGPFTTQYVVPVYKLTDQGTFLQAFANQPGHPAPASPPGCFFGKLGDHVRGTSGEGVIVEAQCTPGQLTQYRVEKPDGDHFWAQRKELNAP